MWLEPVKKIIDGTEVVTGYKYIELYFDEMTGKHRKVSTTLTVNSPQAKKKAVQILNKRIAEKVTRPTSNKRLCHRPI